MRANETALIANTQKRQLTARGYKMIDRLIRLAAEQRQLTRYHKEMRPFSNSIRMLMVDLIIDKRMSESEIRNFINASINTGGLLN